MRLEGEYKWYQSMRKGGRWSISFLLKCTRWLRKEKFAYAIYDGTGQLQPHRSYVELGANDTMRFDYDTCDWDWCQGDTFAVLDECGEIVEHWTLNLQTYAPGECPDCHGTKRCPTCNGTGSIKDQMHMISTCQHCGGTGTCVRCYIPIRSVGGPTINNTTTMQSGTMANANHPTVDTSRQRKMEMLRRRIHELQRNIERAEWDLHMMQISKMDTSSNGVYSSKLQLMNQYHQQLLNLQYELQQLEGM